MNEASDDIVSKVKKAFEDVLKIAKKKKLKVIKIAAVFDDDG